jgi:ABC-type multidrug transport system, ATPase and permease components
MQIHEKKSVFPYLKRYRWILALDLICAALTTVCELILPLVVRYLTNLATTDIKALTIGLVLEVGLFYVVLRIIDAAAVFYMSYNGHMMGAYIETDMRHDLFAHLQKLSFHYFDNTKIGQLMGRITNDLFEITEFAHHCPEEFFIAALKISLTFAILINVNIGLTLMMFAVVPFMLISTLYYNKKMKAASKKSKVQIGEINARAEDSLLGIRVVQSFGNEDLEVKKFAKGNIHFQNIKKKKYLYYAGFESTTRLFDAAMYIIIVVAGGIGLVNSTVTVPDYLAYLMYAAILLNSVKRLVEFSVQFQNGVTGIDRFQEVMQQSADIKDSENAEAADEFNHSIVFENVSFRYENGHEEVISGIDLTIQSGESIAVVGASGIGKTTLCSLIPRYYDVTSGRILIDGKDIRDLTLSSLRRQIGVVQQDSYLFSGTIFENIQYGRPSATLNEVVEAAQKAAIHDFISSLPGSYNTYVGERGTRLSGGQRQRICIARVFLKNPPIVILDEATSALDSENERIVQESLDALSAGRTTLTIAHRKTTIEKVSRVLELTPAGLREYRAPSIDID